MIKTTEDEEDYTALDSVSFAFLLIFSFSLIHKLVCFIHPLSGSQSNDVSETLHWERIKQIPSKEEVDPLATCPPYFFTIVHREEVGMYAHRLGYRHSMKKLIQLQDKIEGWDVSWCIHTMRIGGHSVSSSSSSSSSSSFSSNQSGSWYLHTVYGTC